MTRTCNRLMWLLLAFCLLLVGTTPGAPETTVEARDSRVSETIQDKGPAVAPSGVYYTLDWYSVNNGGAIKLSSASYSTGLSVGQVADGTLSSSSYWVNLGFWQTLGGGTGTCCVLRVGDANNSGEDEPTIGDISVMIDALFIGGDWSIIPCLAEADVNQSGGTDPEGGPAGDITIGDVSYLIDYLFITGSSAMTLPDCL